MEPKKNLKKHKLVEPEWTWSLQGPDLISRINEISEQIHRNTTTGGANWVIMSSGTAELFNEAMRGYSDTRYNDLPEIEMGDFRIDGDTYIQDINIRPNHPIETITVDFDILPSGGEFYSGGTQQSTGVSFVTGSTGTWSFSG